MDIQMPIMDGYEATQQILRMSQANVLALTSYSSELVKDNCMRVGMKEMISKPIDNPTL